MSIDLKTFVNGCSSRCIDDPQEIGKILSQMLQIKGRDFDEDEKLNLDHMSYYALNECSDKRYMTGDERNLTFSEILRFLNNFAVGEELPEKEEVWRIAEVKASLLRSPVRTVCIGTAASMGAILFLAGRKREMLPHTRLMIHDPSYSHNDIGGRKPHEIQHELDKLNETREVLAEIISEKTGKLEFIYCNDTLLLSHVFRRTQFLF